MRTGWRGDIAATWIATRAHTRDGRCIVRTTKQIWWMQGQSLTGTLGQFAPPPDYSPTTSYSFAPPPTFEEHGPAAPAASTPPPPPPPPPPPADIPDDRTGGDAYLRRLRLSQAQRRESVQQSQLDELQPQPQPQQPSVSYMPPALVSFSPPALPQSPAAPAPTMMDPAATISRAPVRYNLPAPPSEIPASEAELEAAFRDEGSAVAEEGSPNEPRPDPHKTEEDQPRSLRPGQKGFAQRLMSKYGWTKGTGLGASGTGIINPLRVQVEKPKRKSDAEGGGFVGPAGGRGKIIGGKKKAKKREGAEGEEDDEEEGRFGRMSQVIVLKGMVDGMDLDAEMIGSTTMGESGSSGNDGGGLMQEIGEECSEKVFFFWFPSTPFFSLALFQTLG